MRRALAAVLAVMGVTTVSCSQEASADRAFRGSGLYGNAHEASGDRDRLYVRRGDTGRRLADPGQLSPLSQANLSQPPGAVAVSFDGKNLYAVTADSVRSLRVQPGGQLQQFQELRNGVTDPFGNTVQYFVGLTALIVSPEGENVYLVGTSVMPGVGGITTLSRNVRSGELSVAQQFRVDQRQGISDIEGMVGVNSVAVSPDGRFVYISSGGYYRDHNLMAFSRDRSAGGLLSLIQNIDVYNSTESRILPTSLVVSRHGEHVYVLGNNYAISTSAIVAFSVDSTTGQLVKIQELGPLRGTLLSTGSFDSSGQFLYVTASLGNNLVWVLKRDEQSGLLTVQVPPNTEGTVNVVPPQGSYAGALSVAVAPATNLLFVALEKENAVYGAVRNPQDGRLTYLAAGGNALPFTLGRPAGVTFDTEGKVLFVSSATENVISAFGVSV